MAKKDTPIALELDRFEKKIKQFQDYLDNHNINKIDDELLRYKEIAAQLTMMKDVGILLGQLGALREQEEKAIATRGDVEINPRMRDKMYADNQ